MLTSGTDWKKHNSCQEKTNKKETVTVKITPFKLLTQSHQQRRPNKKCKLFKKELPLCLQRELNYVVIKFLGGGGECSLP